ncbi:hypothetical protein [Pseudomonas sp. B21-031]|uniref:hypothetical protein n=1 Tax=Pseudomonas sp. B21-031 TaxID=2895482 RepID=UPI002160B65B|nr:hypothetical protein [Pseudomonas sp. B21-031]UVL67181.1 hypothetical protein LOY53_01370 [Pseudomonas sp. B21-031]
MTDTPIPSLPTPALPAAAQPSTVVNQTSAGVLDQNFAALLALNTTQKKREKVKPILMQ